MKFVRQSIKDVVLIQPEVFGDTRGYFVETFRQDLFDQFIGQSTNFVQDNESKSSKGVLRGLHYQLPPYAQAKLVRVIEGRVLDVAVDIRRNSLTFAQYVAVELSDENRCQLFIPHGFAHGFVVLSEQATFAYKVDNYYQPKYDRGIAFNDPELAINWQIAESELSLSTKDLAQPILADVREELFA